MPPTNIQLGADTLARNLIYEVNTGTSGAPIWTPVSGITTHKFSPDTANWVEDTDNNGLGFSSSTKTAATWGATMTVARKVQQGTVSYDVGQEFLRNHAVGVFGPANTVQIRVYEYDPNDPTGVSSPRIEAYMGFVGVEYDPQYGDAKAINTANLTLNGQGAINKITHPYPVTPVAPTITSLSPTTTPVAGGGLVHIYGTGFATTVASGVKFGGTVAPTYSVESDSLIIAVAPAKTAGAQPVTVQNAAGTSTGTNITYV